MKPIVNGLQEEYSAGVEFVPINALDGAEGEAFFQQLGLPGHPSVVLYSADMQQFYRGVGIVDDEELRRQIEIALVDG